MSEHPPTLPQQPRGPSRIQLGRYLVAGRLGEGGMGEVFSVDDPALGRQVAAKVSHASDPEELEKFVREAQVTGQLEHPSIVPLYDLGQTDEGRPYFTMKRIQGRDLSAVVADRRAGAKAPDLVGLLQIFLKVCDAVAFAHSRGVIHRDLKPANIMVGAFGEVVVCDWGLARVEGDPDTARQRVTIDRGTDDALRTLDGTIVGTPAYMPPEQALGEIDQLGPRSDVYALGAILYELLTWEAPYEGSAWAVIDAVAAGSPVPPSRRAPGRKVPWELEAVVMRAMAYEAEDRYPDALALRADVEAYLAGGVLAAAAYTPLQRLSKWGRRHWRGVVAGVVCLVAVIGSLAYYAASQAERARTQAAHARALGERERAAQQASRQARRAARLARSERDRATAALAEARRIGLLRRVQRLEREAVTELWMTRADLETGELRDRLTIARLHAVERTIADWLAEARGVIAKLPDLKRARKQARADLAARPDDDWLGLRAEALSDVVAGVERLATKDGPVAMAADRAATYRGLRERHAFLKARWEQAIDAIARSERYGGLRIPPQVGLVPLGPNGAGLWEFVHLGSGRVPSSSGGSMQLTEKTAILLVLLPGGLTRMGASRGKPGPHSDPYASVHQQPVHQLNLRPFFLGKTELTQFQYRALTGRNPSHYRMGTTVLAGARAISGGHPVESVTWGECVQALAHGGLQLPTCAQWEYAIRAGTSTVWWTGNDKRALASVANLGDETMRTASSAPQVLRSEPWRDGYVIHAPVMNFPARHPFRLFDMIGNVREWCRDRWFDDAYRLRVDLDGRRIGMPPGNTERRVMRGGMWTHSAVMGRSANREGVAARTRGPAIGCRAMRPLVMKE